MFYSDLPNTITSPITGKVLTKTLNDKEAIGTFFDDCTEYDIAVACYTDTKGKESIYIPIDDDIIA